jgi:hypothetical protein
MVSREGGSHTYRMRGITVEGIETMRTALRHAYSRWDFKEFCAKTSLRADIEDPYSARQWRDFRTLCEVIDRMGSVLDSVLEHTEGQI